MPSFTSPNTRWAALQSRNPLAANAFIYSVVTTKIYCRPTCPSRLARRANIVFHDTPTQAEADGFRPCKRCRPNISEDEGDPQRIAVAKACKLIAQEVRGDDKWAVKALAAEVGLTESHFCRVFKKIMGVTVGAYRARAVVLGGHSSPEITEFAIVEETTECHPTSSLQVTFPEPTSLAGNEVLITSHEFSEILQDWEYFSGFQAPVNTPLFAFGGNYMEHYDCNLAVPYSPNHEIVEDCFQFVDFNDPLVE